MHEPLISIIIPCYNVENYLDNCIRSVRNQTFSEWEIILINDGSQDCTPKICDYWMMEDSRIRVIHQTNKGVSAARNMGLRVATAKFVCFIDSDDTVGPNYLQGLIDTQQKYNSLLTVSGFMFCASAESKIEELKVPETFFDKKDFIKLFSLPQFQFLLRGPCCKLYERDVIEYNNLRFDTDIHYGEDTIFVLRYCLLIESISFSTDVSYYYYRRPTGLVNSKCIRQNAVNEIKAFTKIFQTWAEIFKCKYYEVPYFLDTFGLLYGRFHRGSTNAMSLNEHIKSFTYLNINIFQQLYPPKTTKDKIYQYILKYSPRFLGLLDYLKHK